jgi:hypothetical protein
MVKIQRILEKAKIILNSDDAVKTFDTTIINTIPVTDPPLIFDSTASSCVSTTTHTITHNDHGFVTGEAVVYTIGTTAIAPLTTNTTYYVIRTGQHSFQLATSELLANAGTNIIFTNTGSGTHNFKREVTFDGSLATVVIIADSRMW